MPSLELYPSPLEPPLRSLIAAAKHSIFVASPYINGEGLSILAEAVREGSGSCGLELLTSITIPSLREGTLDLRALEGVFPLCASTRVFSLPGLHAKV